MKDLFQRRKGTAGAGGPNGGPCITLDAFGKHPGWDDHILGLGLETDTLAQARQTLYVAGVGGQIDAGAWEKLDADKRLADFDHTILWLGPGLVIAGLMWSSRDGKGRAKYPMVVCAEGGGVAPAWMLAKVLPVLEQLRETCRAAGVADEVKSACLSTKAGLERLLSGDSSAHAAVPPSADARRRFLQHPDLGPDSVGFRRVLHELAAAPGLTGRGGAPGAARSCHLRLPTAGQSRNEAISLWSAFLRTVFPESTPLLFLVRPGVDWFDVVIGEPVTGDFFCLQASLKALPLTTQIPYELAAASQQQFDAVAARFSGEETATSFASKSAPPAAPAQSPASTSPDTTTTRKSRFPFFFGALLLLAALAAGGVWFFAPKTGTTQVANNSPPPAAQPALAPAAPSPPPATPVPSSSPPNPTLNPNPNPPKTEPSKPVETEAELAVKRAQATYDAALSAARAADQKKDYAAAITQAQAALKAKPNDETASKLLESARTGQASVQAASDKERKYQAAMAEAQTQLNRNTGFDVALRHAEEALSLKPNDPAALELRSNIETRRVAAAKAAEATQQFQTVVSAAQAAYDRKDYSEALKQAETALKLKPDDTTAIALQANADAQIKSAAVAAKLKQDLDAEHATLKQQQDYQTALTAAYAALKARDFRAASDQALNALKIKPGDAEAALVRDQAQAGFQAAAHQEQVDRQYKSNVEGARAALLAGDNNQALGQAQAALALRPGDESATALVQQVQDRIKQTAAVAAAAAAAAVPAAQANPAPLPAQPLLTNSLGMIFVWLANIPPQGLYVGEYEVTQAQYRQVMGKLPDAQVGLGDNLPVDNLSYKDAQAFCAALSQQDKRTYELPSRAEWLAAAGITEDQVPAAWNLSTNRLRNEVTSYGSAQALKEPVAIGTRGAQANGLSDVLGNVREWVSGSMGGEIAGFSYRSLAGQSKDLFLPTNYSGIKKETGFRCVVRNHP